MPYNPSVQDQTGELIARGIRNGTEPMTEEEWRRRQQLIRDLGFKDDSLLMRGNDWRAGLSTGRDELRGEALDAVRRQLGLSAGKEAAKSALTGSASGAATGAAAGGGLKGLFSSL